MSEEAKDEQILVYCCKECKNPCALSFKIVSGLDFTYSTPAHCPFGIKPSSWKVSGKVSSKAVEDNSVAELRIKKLQDENKTLRDKVKDAEFLGI